MKKEGFSPLDWNFDTVPDSELVACCYWEYARESAFIRDVKRRFVDPRCRKMHNPELWEFVGNDIERIQSIGYSAEVFLSGFFFNQSEDRKPRHPDAPPITGRFPAPWQSLDGAEQKYRAHIRSHVEQFRIVPVGLAHWGWAKDITRYCQSVADQQHEKQKAWERDCLRRDAKGNFYTLPGAPEGPKCEPIRPGIRWGSCESLLIDIAWEEFTDDEIATCFRKWVKRARPKEVKAPSDRGHKPKDWRSQLTRLAVMRLLSRFTPKEILGGQRSMAIRECRLIRESRQFASDKWAEATKWHDARREAGGLFRRLFPFLPADEKPLSWERQPRAK